jgi:RNA ligase
VPKLHDLFDTTLLDTHIADRVVTDRDLADSTLGILNYTARAQYENIWDDVTRQCRGLIYDNRNLEVVARPFPKFFNYNTERFPETHPANLPLYDPFVTRKYDGSLGIGYKPNGKWRVATRGSFHSEQAEWATKWLRSRDEISLPDGWTPLFEIVYAQNKIVVDYDWEGLVLIGMVNIETGAEIAPGGLKFIAEANGLRPVEYFDRPVSALLQENKANEEGYVLSWHIGDGAPLRVKVKFEDYCRLHRLVHQTSAVTIWEMLRDRKNLQEILSAVPEPFQLWVQSVAADIRAKKQDIENRSLQAFNAAPAFDHRKYFAEYAKKHGELTPLLFAYYDGKDTRDMVWKMVRPSSAQPFKQEEA